MSSKENNSHGINTSKKPPNQNRPSVPAYFSGELNRPNPIHANKRLTSQGNQYKRRLRKEPMTEDVENFVVRTFLGGVLRLKNSKGMSCSFKLSMHFDHKETVLESEKVA